MTKLGIGSKRFELAFLIYIAVSPFSSGDAWSQTRPCPPILNESDATSSSADCRIDATKDWLYRSTLPGVKWAHNFESDEEITFWLWAGGIGDDPNRESTGGKLVTRDTSDFVSGGGSLKLLREAGTAESASWWRPMSAMQESGRGEPDIGYAESSPTISSPRQNDCCRIATWPHGNYGPSSTGEWEGSEFYLQMRMKLDPVRRDDETVGGKIIYLTRTERSLVAQEVVTYYRGGPPHTFGLYKAGSPAINNDVSYVDHVYDEWFTVLYRIVPGDENQPNTTIEVWRALQGESSYTKIYEVLDEAIDYQDTYNKAWNAVLISIYHNGIELPEFWQKYDEIIFSTEYIPPPAN